jgi:hypothetical protein
LDPKGSYADAHAGNTNVAAAPLGVTNPPSGRLMVYIHGEGVTMAPAGKTGAAKARYSIYDESGAFMKEVVNQLLSGTEVPDEVPLQPGRYLIKVTGGEKHPIFWVRIEASKISAVDIRKLSAPSGEK